jgi:hypothetical protein
VRGTIRGCNVVKERHLVQTPHFVETLAILGGAQRIDEAISSVEAFLRWLADEEPIVRGTKGLRMIPTTPVTMRDGTMVPGLEIWFAIVENDSTVELREIDFKQQDDD